MFKAVSLKKNTIQTLLIASFTILSACSSFQAHRGSDIDPKVLSKLKTGISQDGVRSLLGAPTTVAPFDKDRWYYMYTKTEFYAFFHPKVIKRYIIAVQFNAQGNVSEIRRYSEKDALPVKMDPEETKTSGYEQSMLRDLFGNFGRYSAMESKNAPK